MRIDPLTWLLWRDLSIVVVVIAAGSAAIAVPVFTVAWLCARRPWAKPDGHHYDKGVR